MKNFLYTFTFLLFSAFSVMAQEVAICGFDASGGTSTAGDEFTFVLLRDFTAGEVIYFTEDEYSVGSSAFLSGEGHLAYTVPAGGLLENEVVGILENGANTFSVQCGTGGTAVHLGGSGTWSYSASDELYAYSASNATTPWSSVTEIHCFYYGSVILPPVDSDPTPHYPNVIKINPNLGTGGAMNADFNDASRANTTLAILQNAANWTTSGSGISLSCTNFTNQMLPVELVAFSAVEKNEDVYLSWTTASEINNQYFQIEHSIDGRYFEKIEQVDGVGNSELMNHYNFTHRDPANGVNYYRLKQVDFDGRFEYSDIVSVQLRILHAEVSVYPNPFEQSVTVQFPSLENNYSGTIEVYDIYGKRVHRVSLNESKFTLDLSNLVPGAYFLKAIENKRTIITQRIMKF